MANGHGGARQGAGRKSKDQELKELELYNETISDEDWKALIRSVYTKAIKGDTTASRLLFERRFGKVVEIDTGGNSVILQVMMDDKE